MSKAAELANLIGNINAGGGGANRNYIINSGMTVSQRGTSTTGLKNTGAIYTIDRFSYRRSGSWSNFDSKHEQVDVTDSLPVSKGLHKALRVTCTTAEGSVPSGTEATGIGYFTERQDLYRFGVGTANMKTMTISFYVKASIAATYGFTIQAVPHSTMQQIDIPFTVSSANTYERISITIPTYNVALDSTADNAGGWHLFWSLDGVASSRTASTWGDSSDGLIMPNGVSTTGFSNTLNATFEITGVQLEVGQNPTELEHKSFAEELALCQRYYTRYTATANAAYGPSFQGTYNDTTSIVCVHRHTVPMRAAATFGFSQLSDFDIEAFDAQPSAMATFSHTGTDHHTVEITDPSARTKGFAGVICCDTSGGFYEFNAEL